MRVAAAAAGVGGFLCEKGDEREETKALEGTLGAGTGDRGCREQRSRSRVLGQPETTQAGGRRWPARDNTGRGEMVAGPRGEVPCRLLGRSAAKQQTQNGKLAVQTEGTMHCFKVIGETGA